MKGLILAAGRGSRMRDLTEDKPKCLIELAGKTLLSWQINALNGAGIHDIIVVRGYKSESLTPEALSMKKDALVFVDNIRWRETNMLSSMLCASSMLKNSTCVVSYADIVYRADHVAKLIASEYDIAITYDSDWLKLWSLRFDDPLADAETFKQTDGKVNFIGDEPSSYDEIHGQYMGLLKITPNGWKIIYDECDKMGLLADKTDMTSFLKRLLAERVPIGAVEVLGGWCEVDNEQDLEKYENSLNSLNWSHDWRD
jgi:choline kinase